MADRPIVGRVDTVAVTGARGRPDRWISDALADEYEVVCVDIDHPGFEADARENAYFRAAHRTERGEVSNLSAS